MVAANNEPHSYRILQSTKGLLWTKWYDEIQEDRIKHGLSKSAAKSAAVRAGRQLGNSSSKRGGSTSRIPTTVIVILRDGSTICQLVHGRTLIAHAHTVRSYQRVIWSYQSVARVLVLPLPFLHSFDVTVRKVRSIFPSDVHPNISTYVRVNAARNRDTSERSILTVWRHWAQTRNSCVDHASIATPIYTTKYQVETVSKSKVSQRATLLSHL